MGCEGTGFFLWAVGLRLFLSEIHPLITVAGEHSLNRATARWLAPPSSIRMYSLTSSCVSLGFRPIHSPFTLARPWPMRILSLADLAVLSFTTDWRQSAIV